MGLNDYGKLLGPGLIGTMTTRNRVVMPGMGQFFMDDQGRPASIEVSSKYYEARARGGVGLVIVEVASVDYDRGRVHDAQLRIDNESCVPEMAQIAEAIKKHGARAAVQLQHGGAAAKAAITGQQPMGPSGAARPGYCDTPRAMSIGEIEEVISRFARSARRAREAGFDAVEIHACHSYLLEQFLSGAWNKRTDVYGGTLKGRAKLLLDVINAVRNEVGPDFPVWCRLNGKEFGVEGGIVIEETRQVALWAQEAGVVALNISAQPALASPYHDYDPIGQTIPVYGPGCFVDMAASVKELVKVPVIVAGKIDPELGEKLLQSGRVDFIAMGRQLIADPDMVNKLTDRKRDEVRPCLRCNCCLEVFKFRGCTVNAARGKEAAMAITPAPKPKKVVVVGGGPAGMEAARVAALRGHHVTLFEKSGRLGGQLIFASLIKSEYEDLSTYLATQMAKRGVTVRLGEKFNSPMVDALRPDAVVVATGGTGMVPNIPGIDGNNVIGSGEVHEMGEGSFLSAAFWRRTILWLGSSWLRSPRAPLVKWSMGFLSPFGRTVAVLGSGLAAVEMAHYLHEKGKKVIMLTENDTFAGGKRPMYLLMMYYLKNLIAAKVTMMPNVRYEEISPAGILISDKNGRQMIKVDTIVLAVGRHPNDGLVTGLKGKVPEVHIVGDSVNPCGIREAIADGSRVGLLV